MHSVGIASNCSLLAFPLSVSLVSTLPSLLNISNSISRTYRYSRLLIGATLVLTAAVKLTTVKSHGNSVLIERVISRDTQSHKQINGHGNIKQTYD